MKSYATKLERICEISLKFQPPNIITIHLHSFKIITRFPFYSLSFSQLPRLIIVFLLKKLMRISIFKIELKIMFGEKENSQ
jgi:riboflavin transporter FmnP